MIAVIVIAVALWVFAIVWFLRAFAWVKQCDEAQAAAAEDVG